MELYRLNQSKRKIKTSKRLSIWQSNNTTQKKNIFFKLAN
jgi:hypothetical protein